MSMLERSSPPPQTQSFLKTVLIVWFSLLVTSYFAYMPFAASYFSFTMLYIWSWKHPLYRISILGLFDVKAPYVPWVMVLLRWLRTGIFPLLDLISALIGHVYFFVTDFSTVWRLKRIRKEKKVNKYHTCFLIDCCLLIPFLSLQVDFYWACERLGMANSHCLLFT